MIPRAITTSGESFFMICWAVNGSSSAPGVRVRVMFSGFILNWCRASTVF